jgi:hypothetical protein
VLGRLQQTEHGSQRDLHMCVCVCVCVCVCNSVTHA